MVQPLLTNTLDDFAHRYVMPSPLLLTVWMHVFRSSRSLAVMPQFSSSLNNAPTQV